MAVKTFNLDVFKQDLKRASPQLEGLMFANAKRSFEVEKRITLGNFNNHPVTVELDAGPSTTNSVLDYGNLYSLLGFEPGKDLTGPIYDVLERDLQIGRTGRRPTVTNSNMLFHFKYTVPSFADIERASETPPEWATKSWVNYIENGIPYFAYYIFNAKGFNSKSNSRSGYGLQKRTRVRGQSTAKKIPYVKEIISNFIKNIASRFGV